MLYPTLYEHNTHRSFTYSIVLRAGKATNEKEEEAGIPNGEQVDMSLDRQNKHVWEKSEGGIGSTKFCRSEQHISKVEYSSSFCALMSCFQLV